MRAIIIEATKGEVQRDSMIPNKINILSEKDRRTLKLGFGINAIPLDASSSCSGITKISHSSDEGIGSKPSLSLEGVEYLLICEAKWVGLSLRPFVVKRNKLVVLMLIKTTISIIILFL